MMRVYTCEFENVAVSAAQDFFELTPADDKPIKLLALMLANVGADVGDAEEEMLRWRVIRGHTTSGSGGSTATPRALNRSGAAAGFTCEINNTTIASAGTTHNLHSDGWNVRVPLQLYWPNAPDADMRPGASQADTTIVVRLLAAPADAVTMSGTLYVGEEG